jgi:hypothetical protein
MSAVRIFGISIAAASMFYIVGCSQSSAPTPEPKSSAPAQKQRSNAELLKLYDSSSLIEAKTLSAPAGFTIGSRCSRDWLFAASRRGRAVRSHGCHYRGSWQMLSCWRCERHQCPRRIQDWGLRRAIRRGRGLRSYQLDLDKSCGVEYRFPNQSERSSGNDEFSAGSQLTAPNLGPAAAR